MAIASGLLMAVLMGVLAGGTLLARKSQTGAPKGLTAGARLAPCPSTPNCVSSDPATRPGARIDPLPGGGPERADELMRVMADLGAEPGAARGRYLAFTMRSNVFGFVDDVEFLVGDDATHVRAASRVGYSDLGVNARRVAAIRARLGVD